MDVFNQVLNLFQTGLLAWGSIYCIMGIVDISQGLKEHAGTQLNSGITTVVSGGLVCGGSALLGNVSL